MTVRQTLFFILLCFRHLSHGAEKIMIFWNLFKMTTNDCWTILSDKMCVNRLNGAIKVNFHSSTKTRFSKSLMRTREDVGDRQLSPIEPSSHAVNMHLISLIGWPISLNPKTTTEPASHITIYNCTEIRQLNITIGHWGPVLTP